MRPIDPITHQPVENEPGPDLSRAALLRWLQEQGPDQVLGHSDDGSVLQQFVRSQGFNPGNHGWDEINWRQPALRYVYSPVYLSLFGHVMAMRYYGHRPRNEVTGRDALAALNEIPPFWDALDNNREARTPRRALHTGHDWERWLDRWQAAFGTLRAAAIESGQPYAHLPVTVTL